METREVKIIVPEGMEIDTKNSTFECIKFKPIEIKIKTWDDLIGKNITGFFIDGLSEIGNLIILKYSDKNTAATEKYCKKILAIAQISQLMPYYGDVVTDEEWKFDSYKYTITRNENHISTDFCIHSYEFLAFHTEEQCNEFLENNEQLVKDYLMLD